MLLKEAQKWLGWPQPGHITDPPGEGAKVYADFAKRKIEDSLKRSFPNLLVDTGILAVNPQSTDTSAPLAVVCEFKNPARPDVLNEAHRLAWNFSRTALLITLEPHQLIAWSCYCDPMQPENKRRICELPTPEGFTSAGSELQRYVRDLLHWVSLITGTIQRKYPKKFPANGRADRLLLSNLIDVRHRLIGMGLGESYCHDLLARIIFTQYLFHRKDSDGNLFFNPALLGRLSNTVFRKQHADLISILHDHQDTYALFKWMDERFNGDLFPGQHDSTDKDRAEAWKAEREAVTPEHLKLLADMVSGTVDTRNRQLQLWPQYSFDTIPLEFISSVYEEFLNEARYKNKAFYTPSHLVDYVLDAVLPWDGDKWDTKILDPSCGSGIFLVKAFQRLIYRWKRAHKEEPIVSDIKPILAKQLFGIDTNPEAVRVACFSLYLAMADAIEPKHYVTREKVFPRLRGTRLVASDFFDEKTEGFRTKEDGCTFDLVIGNAPWGDGSAKKTSESATIGADVTKAEAWADANGWPIANHDIGPLFLCKSLKLVSSDGNVALVQPAGPWLYHRADTAFELRKHLFESCTVEEITNLSLIRKELFKGVIGPACVIVAQPRTPCPDDTLFYFSPKPIKSPGPGKEFTVEPQDISQISHREAAADPLVWPVLALGGRRDLELIRKLNAYPTLKKMKAEKKVCTRNGVIPGDKQKELSHLKDIPYFELPQFPPDVFLELDASQIRKWRYPRVHSKDSTDFRAFHSPQLLIKQSLSAETLRFRAALVHSDDPIWGVICKETYLSVHDLSPDARNIKVACLIYNSRLATYFLTLSSSRLGHYITESLAKELVTVPLPESAPDVSGVSSFEDVDELVRDLFLLSKADWSNVEDLLDITLPDLLRTEPGPGRGRTTRRDKTQSEPEMIVYAETFSRVVKGTFGTDKGISATIYQESNGEKLPVRVMTLHFDWPGRSATSIETIEADGLFDQLATFHQDITNGRNKCVGNEGLGFRRVAFFLHSHQVNGTRIKNLTIIKPDERRYWSRSLAMREADDLSAAILKAAGWRDS